MNPSTHAVVPGHHRADDDISIPRHEKQLWLYTELPVDHVRGMIVRGIAGERRCPEIDDALAVAITERRDFQPRCIHTVSLSDTRVSVPLPSLTQPPDVRA